MSGPRSRGSLAGITSEVVGLPSRFEPSSSANICNQLGDVSVKWGFASSHSPQAPTYFASVQIFIGFGKKFATGGKVIPCVTPNTSFLPRGLRKTVRTFP